MWSYAHWRFGYPLTWALSKADISLKQTVALVLKVSALERVDCNTTKGYWREIFCSYCRPYFVLVEHIFYVYYFIAQLRERLVNNLLTKCSCFGLSAVVCGGRKKSFWRQNKRHPAHTRVSAEGNSIHFNTKHPPFNHLDFLLYLTCLFFLTLLQTLFG